MTSRRAERVGGLLREEISSILRNEIKDPRIGFITITRVVVTNDLSLARVFFSIIGTKEDRDRSIEGLNSASSYIRRALGKRLNLKHIPDINFRFDESLEYSSRIEELIKEIRGG
ncbi:MAG: 30S ribosome-binding factor RbfA [Deltaproteobacteria bacterium]|nr:30S ribosome-binding factor RbfA [Deltaproteobacteria bacterium]